MLGSTVMSSEEEELEVDPAILQRVRRPGMLLTVAGIVNVLIGLFLFYSGIRFWLMPIDEVRAQQRAMLESLDRIGLKDPDGKHSIGVDLPPDQFQHRQTQAMFSWAFVALFASFPITYAGYNLRTLNSFGLAFTGAVLAGIPIISPTGCFGLGQIAGIWALALLLNRQVRASFAR